MFLISLLLFVDSQPWLRYAVTSAMLGLLGWMALCPGNDRSRKKRNWIFIALLALSLFWLRYPILFYPRYLEIDEAQMLSQAITFQSHPIPWVDVDGTTSGPLNSYVLLWCVPLGLHPTYFTTRLFGLFCLAGMLGLLYLACQSVAGTRLARLCVLPTFLFFGFVTFYDWVHYTSEHLSLFLLAWVIYLLTRLRRSSDSLYCISLLGLLLGITPFAKLQSTLPAGFLGLLGIVLLLKQGRHLGDRRMWLRIFLLIGSAVLPGMILLSIVAHAGGLHDFWQSYIRLGEAFVSGTNTLRGRFLLVQLQFLNARNDLAFPVYLTLILALGLLISLLLGNLKISRTTCLWLGGSSAFAMVTIVTAVTPGTPYAHYALYLTLALPVLTAACLRAFRTAFRIQPADISLQLRRLQAIALALMIVILSIFLINFALGSSKGHHLSPTQTPLPLIMWLLAVFSSMLFFLSRLISQNLISPSIEGTPRLRKWAVITYALIFFLLPALMLAVEPNPYIGKIRAFRSTPPQPIDLVILHFRPPGGRLAIWGYEPDLTAETETPQGTRDSIAEREMLPTTALNYYRNRYLQDMQANRPALFLEATGPHNYGYLYLSRYGLETFPELAKYIQEHYQLCQVVDGMRLFIRSDLAKDSSGTCPETHP